MPVLLDWFSEDDAVLYFTIIDPWTMDEFLAMNQQADQTAAQADCYVDIIIDFTHAKTIPPGRFLSQMKDVAMRSIGAKNVGLAVLLNMHPAQESIARALLNAYPQLRTVFQIVNSLEEGLEILAAARSAREDAPADQSV